MTENFDRAQIVAMATPMTAWIAALVSDEVHTVNDVAIESYPVVALRIDPLTGEGDFLVAFDDAIEPLSRTARLADGTLLLGVHPGSDEPRDLARQRMLAARRFRDHARALTAEEAA